LFAVADESAQGTLFPQPRILGGRGPYCSMRLSGRAGASASMAVPHSKLNGAARRQIDELELTTFHIGTALDAASLAPEVERRHIAVELEGVMAGWFDRHGCRAAIVRPDHYVFGVARDEATLIGVLCELHDRLLESRTTNPSPSRSKGSQMKLATFQMGGAPSWGLVDGETIKDVGAVQGSRYPTVKSVIVAGRLCRGGDGCDEGEILPACRHHMAAGDP
jgi:hypothetical protein